MAHLLPVGYHLNIVTRKRISQWTTSGLSDVFVSAERSIVSASETPGEGRIMAIADGRVVMLHDLLRSETKKSHKLGSTARAAQILVFGQNQQLYFTTCGYEYVFEYSSSKDRVTSKIELPSCAATLAISKLYLLVTCIQQDQAILVALQSKQVWRFGTNNTSSTVTASAFHPSRSELFVLASADGSLSMHDALGITSTSQRPHAGRLESIRGLHNAAGSRSSTLVVAVAFIEHFPARVVTVGHDRKGQIVDFEKGAQVLFVWNLDCIPTCITVLSQRAVDRLPGSRLTPMFAIGRADGRVSLYDTATHSNQVLLVDLQHNSIISVEWIRGIAAPAISRHSERECLPGSSGNDALGPRSRILLSTADDRTRKSRRLKSHGSKYSVLFENASSTPKASQMPWGGSEFVREKPQEGYPHGRDSRVVSPDLVPIKAKRLGSPQSRRSSVASFSSALSHLHTPLGEDLNETIIVTKNLIEASDFGFADVDATRIYTKPTRPRGARRSRLLRPASNGGPMISDSDWQTVQWTSPMKRDENMVVGSQAGRLPTRSSKNRPRDRPAAPSLSHLTSVTTWSKNSPASARSPTRLSRQRVRPAAVGHITTNTERTRGKPCPLRRSVPLDQAVASLLNSKPTNSGPLRSTPTPEDIVTPHRNPVPNPSIPDERIPPALMRSSSKDASNQGYRSSLKASSEGLQRYDSLALLNEAPTTKKPLRGTLSMPSPTQPNSTRRPTSNRTGWMPQSAPPVALVSLSGNQPQPASLPTDYGQHHCPCNCAVVAYLDRLQAQITLLNDTFAHAQESQRAESHLAPRNMQPNREVLARVPTQRSRLGDSWIKVGRFLVRRAEVTGSSSSWRRRAGQRKVKVLHHRRAAHGEGSDKTRHS